MTGWEYVFSTVGDAKGGAFDQCTTGAGTGVMNPFLPDANQDKDKDGASALLEYLGIEVTGGSLDGSLEGGSGTGTTTATGLRPAIPTAKRISSSTVMSTGRALDPKVAGACTSAPFGGWMNPKFQNDDATGDTDYDNDKLLRSLAGADKDEYYGADKKIAATVPALITSDPALVGSVKLADLRVALDPLLPDHRQLEGRHQRLQCGH